VKYALMILFVFLAVLTARAERIAIAVLDLDAKGEGLSQGVADALTETVRYEFAKQESIDLVAREKMRELAKEKAIQLSGCTDVACAVQIGKALNVQKMVMGSVTKLGDHYALFLRAVDVEKEKVECSEKEDAGTDIRGFEKISQGLVGKVLGCMWEPHWRSTVQRKPWDSEAHYNLGNVLRNQGKTVEAIKEYREAIRLNPGDADAHFLLGTALEDQGKPNEAIKEYRETISLNPDDAVAHTLLGMVLEDQGKTVEAMKEYREAIRLKPNFVLPIRCLALILDVQDRRREARMYWERVVKLENSPESKKAIIKRLAEPD